MSRSGVLRCAVCRKRMAKGNGSKLTCSPKCRQSAYRNRLKEELIMLRQRFSSRRIRGKEAADRRTHK